MKIFINIFIVFIFAFSTASCTGHSFIGFGSGDQTAVGNNQTCTNTDQVLDVSNINSVTRALDVARAADLLKMPVLKSKALARADAIFDANIKDPEVYPDDPAVDGFPADKSAAAYLMMRCEKAMDIYGAKADSDEVARLKLEAQRADIDLTLLAIATDDMTAKSDSAVTQLQAAEARAVGKEAPVVRVLTDDLPFFCVPCEIILGISSSSGNYSKGQFVLGAQDAAFNCDSKDLITLCDTMMSGSPVGSDPCGVKYDSLTTLTNLESQTGLQLVEAARQDVRLRQDITLRQGVEQIVLDTNK